MTPVTVAGKRCVVVGGTSGLGSAIARGFAEDGAEAVVATSRSAESVAETAAEIRDAGATTLERACDVTDRDSIVSLHDAVLDAFGGVDEDVYSAGAIARASLREVTEDEWDRVLSVQLDGVYRTMQVFTDALAADGGGSVVNVSSLSARLANPEQAAYSAAKGGVDSLTRVAATELGPEIRVNAVRPGFFATPQTADAYGTESHRVRLIEDRSSLGRMGDPDELVGSVVYLVVRRSGRFNIGALSVDIEANWFLGFGSDGTPPARTVILASHCYPRNALT